MLVEPDLPGKAEKVPHVLVQYTPREAWKSGKVIKCTLSNARIAGLSGLNKRSVVRLLALLEERGWLVRQYVRIRPEAWQKAVERHRWAALVVVDRQGIKNPGAYLFSMLQSTILRETVSHNLRALIA